MDQDSDQSQGLGLPSPAANTQDQQPGTIPAPSSAPQYTANVLSAQPEVPSQTTPTEEPESSDIDQDWINKARDIVERTKGDPFVEVQELNKIKSGYLKVRYNKDIKSGEAKTK